MENGNIYNTEDLRGFLPTCDYDSHRPFLYLASIITNTPFYELGCGYGSTDILHQHCKQTDRLFFSFETNPEWHAKFADKVKLVNDYKELELFFHGILFIDSAPGEERKILIDKFRNQCELMIIHDTEIDAEYVYGMRDVLSKFKYRIDLKINKLPSTTMVSNFIDLNKWKGVKIFDYVID